MSEQAFKNLGFTAREAFWAANTGPMLLRRLLDDTSHSYMEVFSDYILKCMTDYACASDDLIRAVFLIPVLDAFLDKTYPVSDPKERKIAIINWICERYLNETFNGKQILAEDLYKIGEDLNFFEGLRRSGGAIQGTDITVKGKNITDFKSLAELREFLNPFEQRRNAKKEKDFERSLTPEQREKIADGTTVICEGPEGRAVIVHTEVAAKYHGNNTKWCISADTNNAFDDYNKSGHILILLPKGSQKYALVEEEFYDAGDNVVAAPDKAGRVLLEAARNHLSIEAKENLDRLIPDTMRLYRDYGDEMADMIVGATRLNDPDDNIPEKNLSNDSFKREVILRAPWLLKNWPDISTNSEFILGVAKDISSINSLSHYVDSSLFSNADFVREYLKLDGKALKFCSDNIKDDDELVLIAVQENGLALFLASDRLQNDKDIVIAALDSHQQVARNIQKMRQDWPLYSDRDIIIASKGKLLNYIDSDMNQDRQFMLDAIEKTASAYMKADSRFWEEDAFNKEAFKRNRAVIYWLPEEYQVKAFSLIAVQQSVKNLTKLWEKISEDKTFLFDAMNVNPLVAIAPEIVTNYSFPIAMHLDCLEADEIKTLAEAKITAYRLALEQGYDLAGVIRNRWELWGNAERVLGSVDTQIDYLESILAPCAAQRRFTANNLPVCQP